MTSIEMGVHKLKSSKWLKITQKYKISKKTSTYLTTYRVVWFYCKFTQNKKNCAKWFDDNISFY